VVARAALYGSEHFPCPFPRDTGPLDVPGQIRAKQDETPYHHYQKCQVLICVILYIMYVMKHVCHCVIFQRTHSCIVDCADVFGR
jgi:hypothetical protein